MTDSKTYIKAGKLPSKARGARAIWQKIITIVVGVVMMGGVVMPSVGWAKVDKAKIEKEVNDKLNQELIDKQASLSQQRDKEIADENKKIDVNNKLTPSQKEDAKRQSEQAAVDRYDNAINNLIQDVRQRRTTDLTKAVEEAEKRDEILQEKEQFEATQILRPVGDDVYVLKFFKEAEARGISPVVAFILTVIDFLVKIMASFSFLVMIAGAFMMMVAMGESTRYENGKNMIIYSLVGLAVALSAFIIATFVQSLITGQ